MEAEKDLNKLRALAMSFLMQSEAKTHKRFFTQKEFESNMGLILNINSSYRKVRNHLIKTNN